MKDPDTGDIVRQSVPDRSSSFSFVGVFSLLTACSDSLSSDALTLYKVGFFSRVRLLLTLFDRSSAVCIKIMRETLVFLTHLDHEDTHMIMTSKLQKQVSCLFTR